MILVGAVASFFIIKWPALSLVLGIAIGLLGLNPDPKRTKKLQTLVLSLAIVLMGAGLNFTTAIRVGSQGVLMTAGLMSCVFLVGYWLYRFLGLGKDEAILISVGTAVCGGSAIAAVAGVLRPKDSSIALSLAIVFLLNAVGLVILPPLGHHYGLSQGTFGWWAALAIHDTSSVVGASLAYGREALEIGTTAKLARALWIVPIATILSWQNGRKSATPGQRAKISLPWFIPTFIVMSALFSFVPMLSPAREPVIDLAKRGFVLALFLVGVGISMKAFKETSGKAFLFGICLWVFSLLASAWPARLLGGH